MLGDLSPAEYGAYCRILSLAALTNNRTVYNPRTIKRRTDVSAKIIERLRKRNLIDIVSFSDVNKKHQQKQSKDDETASGNSANPPQTAAPEGRGRDKTGFDKEGTGVETSNGSPSGISKNRKQPKFPDMVNACRNAGVSGSDWQSMRDVLQSEFAMNATDKQLATLQTQLNDRARK